VSLHLIVGVFLTCVVSGFLPWVSAEVIVGAAVLATTRATWPFLVGASAAGQMLAKVTLYSLARWAPGRLPARAAGALLRLGRLTPTPAAALLAVFSSAAVGLPPLYLTTLGAGVVRLSLPLFMAAGTLGILLRYSAVAWGAARLAGAAGGAIP